MAAPNSAHTRPSQTANRAPKIQPSMACGPPIALIIKGMVMKGPTPIMSIMFRAVALPRPTPRMRVGEVEADSVGDGIEFSGQWPVVSGQWSVFRLVSMNQD